MNSDYDSILGEAFGVDKVTPPETDQVDPPDWNVADQYSVAINPDNESDIARLSEETGIGDVDFVRDNYESLAYTNHRAKLRNSIEEKPVTKELYDNVIDESWASGDYEQLGTIESIIRDIKQGWNKGSAVDDIGTAGWDQMWAQDPKYAERVDPIRQELSRGRTGDLGWWTGLSGTAAETVSLMVGMVPETVAGGAAGVATGAAAGTVVPGAGTVGGAVTGGAWGMRAGATYAMGKLEAGAAYDEYIQMKDASGNYMDHDAAKGAALLVGTVNGLLEMVSIERIARTIPGADKFLGRIASKNMKALLGHPTMRGALANFGARMTSVTLGEGVIEALQEVVTLGGKLVAAGIDGDEFETPTLREAGEVAWSAFRQGTQAGFALGLPGNIVSGYYEAKAASITDANTKAIELINDTAQDINSLEGHPKKVQQAVEKMQKLHESSDTVYIDPDALTTFFQEAGVDEAQVQAEMPGTYAQIVEARANGGSVAVPLGEYITHIAPSKNASSLSADTKFNPDDLTQNELAKVKDKIAELQKNAADDAPQTQIFQNIQQQLVEAGQAPEAAAQMALLWESTFEAFGDRLPITSQEFFDQFQIKIQREKDATEGLNVFEQESIGSLQERLSKVEGVKSLHIYEGSDNTIKLETIIVDKESRKSGVGSSVMDELISYADMAGKRVTLQTAVKDDFQGTTSQARLKKFYKRFGFVENKGRNKDFAVSGNMYREPSKGNRFDQAAYHGTPSPFDNWVGDAEVIEADDVNDTDFSDGKSYVLKAYHGTTHEFNVFDASKKGQKGGHFGAVNYFTTDLGDADQNYAGEGPDLTARIERRTEQLEDEVADDPERYGTTSEELETRGDEVLYEIARRELSGGTSKRMDVYIKTENPFVVGDGDTYFDALVTDMDSATESIADSYGISKEEAMEQYEDEIYDEAQALAESPLADAVDTVASEFGVDAGEIMQSLYDMMADGEVKTSALEAALRESEQVMYAEDYDTGEMAGPHLIARIIEELGFDSIILKNAGEQFSSMDMGANTAHIHVFDANNTNIKSVDNEGAFDPSNPNIYKQGGSTARGYLQFNDLRDYFSITLTGKANLSTFLHESGHFFLEMMQVAADMDGADVSLKDDLATLYDWMGATPGEKLQVEHHEKFARGFEAYLMEGKAPNAKVAAAFERFKGWLVRIYKSIQALNAPLTNEVRGVMDRLVGVDQGFIQLRGEYKPMYASAEEAGMTDEQYADYLDSYNTFMADAQRQVEREVINDVIKQRTQEYNERKKELTQEVSDELDQEQVYRVRRFLSGQWGRDNPNFAHFPDYLFGEKLDTQSVKDLLGSVPPKLRSMVAPDSALTPDELAPLFGYESGVAMLQELESTPARGAAIYDRVDTRLEEEFGDIILDGKLEMESLDAIHGGNMSDFIARELKSIGQKAGIATQQQKQIAKYVARERVLSVPILALNRSKYLQAERRSASAAQEAMQEGNWLKAADHKMQQLVAHYMYKEAATAQKQAESHRKALVKYTKKPRQKMLAKAGEHYLDAINALLDGVELSARSGKVLARRTNLKQFMDEQAASGIDIAIPQELQDTAKLKNYKQMSLSELASLRDTVDHIHATARLKSMIKTKQGRQKLSEVVDTLVQSMQENAPGAKNEVDARDINKRDLPNWVTSSLVKPEFLMKWIDGETAGYAHSAIFNPLADAQHKENDMLAEMAGKIKPLMDKLDHKRMSATVTIMGKAYTREQAFSIALNMGNRGNLKKLLAGRDWDQASLVRDIQKALTKDDFEVIQGIWDAIDTLWPEMKRVSMDAGFGRPPRVEASELELPELGITLRGGYYPIVYDPRHAETLAYKQTIQIADSIFENNLFNGGVSAGFKEARVEIKKPPPILLSLNVLSKHTGEVIHFITHYEAVKQAEKIVTAPAFASQFKDSFGPEYHKALKSWLKDIANQGAKNEDLTFVPAISQYLRIGMSMVAMGFSFSTMIMQGFGTFTTVDEIGVSYTMKGLRQAMNPTIYKDVIKMSGEIRHITKNMDREIADTLNESFDTNKVTKALRPIKNFAFMHIAYAQRIVNVAAFEGARQKALDEGKSHTDSMQYADAVVRMTQSGAGFKDIARVQSGSEIHKLFTPFYTYFSVLYNRYQDAARDISLKPMSWVKFSQRMMWLTFLPVYTEILMRGDEPDEDENWLSWFAVKNLEYMSTTLPVIREGVKLATSDYAPSPVAAMDIFKDIARTKAAAGKLIFEGYDWDDLTMPQQRNLVETVATLAHLPTKTPWRVYESIVDDDVESPVRHMLMGTGKAKD